MRKTKATILSALAFTALALTGTAAAFAQKPTAFSPVSAKASNAVQAELLAPTSYEQYLALADPSHVAVTENYTAIADGNAIYLYDRENKVYEKYEYANPVNKVAFDGNGNVYFLSALELYKLTVDELKNGAEPTDIAVCNNFAIAGDRLYYYNTPKAIKYLPLNGNGGSGEIPLSASLQDNSPLSYGKGLLYCVCESVNDKNAYTVYEINAKDTVDRVTDFSAQITSMAASDNLFCFTTKSGEFYAYNYTELSASERADSVTPITKADGGYVSLSAYGGNVYAVRENTVCQYSVAQTAFTDYEISSSSSSAHRLSGSTELCLAEDKLFIADGGNQRISVYDTESKTFGTPIATDLPDPYLASYGNTLLVSSAREFALYSLSDKTYGTELLTVDETEIDGNIVGAASVYNRYYVLTDSNYCYTLTAESGAWSWTETQKHTQALFATAFAADVYGSLYVAYDNDAVYRFTEKELLTAEASGTKVLEGLQGAEKLAVDYETDLYALKNGILTKYTADDQGMYAPSAAYTPAYGLVYDESPTVCSFAFGVDEADTYLLYEGDYVVKTDELQIPKVNPIPVGDAADRIFGEENREFSVVTVATDSILIEFDATALKDATQFPYVAFERCQAPLTALKLGEESGYAILSVAQEQTGKYKTYLVSDSACTDLEKSEYYTAYPEQQPTGYLTNGVSLYKFPCLTELLTVGAVERGDTVVLLGEVDQLDHAYYEVLYKTENGETVGYIPKAYITLFDGSTPTSETVTYGETETHSDEVWRLAYLILGMGAIGILVDFLILRKPKPDQRDDSQGL